MVRSRLKITLVSVQQIPLFHFTAHLLLVKPGSKNSQCSQLYSQSCRSKVAQHFTSKELFYIMNQCFSNMHLQQKKKRPRAHLIWILPQRNDIRISDFFCFCDSTLPVSSSRQKEQKRSISPIPARRTTTGTLWWEGQWETGLLDDYWNWADASLSPTRHLNKPWSPKCFPWPRLRWLDGRLCTPAWDEVSNGHLLLF